MIAFKKQLFFFEKDTVWLRAGKRAKD